jgi:uncharacterized membrane protein YbhN (UPF0104 family)
MSAISEHIELGGKRQGIGDRVSAYAFSYLVGGALLFALIYISGGWNFLANTRLLDVMIKCGIIMYHDSQTGVVAGVPDLKYYIKSQDPINWPLVELAAGIFLVFWLIKAVQFHGFMKYCGIKGTFTQAARIYLHGIGVNRLLPFNQGNLSIAEGLRYQGATPDRAALAVFLAELFIVFEIVVYAIIGLPPIGWGVWLAQMFWALVILGIAYLIVKPSKLYPGQSVLQGSWSEIKQIVTGLAHRPWSLASFCILSFLAFGLEDIAVYVIAMAFSGTHVILHVNFSILLMAVVASYTARLIPITPGGIGQFEWGFAAALYVGGVGLPEAVCIAVLDNFIRYAAGTFLLVWVYILRIDYAFELFTGTAPSMSPKPSIAPSEAPGE